MRQYNVRLTYRHCAGSSFVSAGDSVVTFAHYYEIDDSVLVPPEWAELRFAPFGELVLSPPDREGWVAERYRAFLDELTLDDVMDGSDLVETWIIPITRLVFVEGAADGWPVKYAPTT